MSKSVTQQGYVRSANPTKREIWVQRDDGTIEFKVWFIYGFKFIGSSEQKIVDFLHAEKLRFIPGSHTVASLTAAAYHYTDLCTGNRELPPRLAAIPNDELNSMETTIIRDATGCVWGDSVGGIAINKTGDHNLHLKELIHGQENILFSPGVLARIEVEINQQPHFVFQLAAKNLVQKGTIFYKPIGGHLKVTSNQYDALITEFGLIPKSGSVFRGLNDVAFFVPTDVFTTFIKRFVDDTFLMRNFRYFENPEVSIERELFEELGPESSNDGIELLLANDLKAISS